MSINPVSPISPQAISSATTVQPGSSAGGNFGEMFKTYMNQVNTDQQSSAAAIQDLLTGQQQDVLPVISAVAKADMSFKLLVGVRNKVIEAYKQTMNMQI